jgi:hypothetical protein
MRKGKAHEGEEERMWERERGGGRTNAHEGEEERMWKRERERGMEE